MRSIAVTGGAVTGITTAHAPAQRGSPVMASERRGYPAIETPLVHGGQRAARPALPARLLTLMEGNH